MSGASKKSLSTTDSSQTNVLLTDAHHAELSTKYNEAANMFHTQQVDSRHENCFLTLVCLVVTLTFDLLTSEAKQFIYVPICT